MIYDRKIIKKKMIADGKKKKRIWISGVKDICNNTIYTMPSIET